MKNIRSQRGSSALTHHIILCICLFVLLMVSPVQAATCRITASPTAEDLGTTSSFNVNSANGLSTSGPGGVSCSGLSIDLLSGSVLTGTLKTTTNNMNLVNTQIPGAKIPYTLYADNTTSYPFIKDQSVNYGAGGLNILNLLVVGLGGSTTIYTKTTPQQNIPAGTYTDTVTIYWYSKMCLANLLGACISLSLPDEGTSTIQIKLIVTKDCQINTTTDINFGSSAFVDQFPAKTNNTVTLTCSAQTPYKTYFSNGDNYSDPWRQMKGSGSNFLQYNIYYPDNTTVWNSLSKLSGSGNGMSQSLTYSAIVNPNQPAQPAGSYSDTVQFVVEY
ncbi:Csu type fimbrial protein [Limnobaculum parvum]|nr:spore coat protein U domain-containing protein [Limnobaculum parvum]